MKRPAKKAAAIAYAAPQSAKPHRSQPAETKSIAINRSGPLAGLSYLME